MPCLHKLPVLSMAPPEHVVVQISKHALADMVAIVGQYKMEPCHLML